MRDEEMDRQPLKAIKPAVDMMVTVKTYFHPNKVYIIAGGLGGFGMELVPWMLYYGARKFVVTSRSGVKTGYQRWCDYVVSTADCLTIEGTQQLLKETQKLGPIGGIFANLDQLTRKLDYNLDYFVIFSSMACGKGNAGQSNYSFGNSMCERICEVRRRDGLHGLAVQYGPIGDVGVFEGSDQLITLSSLRKQRINSCCDVLDKLLAINTPIVTSFIKADKIQKGAGTKQRMIAELWRALGIDPNTTPNHITLGEIGMESMFAVELQQELEREWNMKISLNQVKSITIGMLKDYESGNVSNVKKHIDHLKRSRANLLKQKFIIPSDPYVRLNGVTKGKPVYFMPTVLLNFSMFEELAQKLNRPAIGLNWTHEVSKLTTLKQILKFYQQLLNVLEPNGQFDVVGYFDGAIVCSTLLLKEMADKAVIVDLIRDHRFCDEKLTDDFLLEFLLTVMSTEIPESFKDKIVREIKKEQDIKVKVRLIVNEIVDFAGKGLVAPDMEEILHVMIARIRMLSEYRLNKRKKYSNRLKLTIGKKWAKKSGKLIMIKPFKWDTVDNVAEFMEKSRDDDSKNISMEMVDTSIDPDEELLV
ncbi:unnamed protein product [Oppiella nova]|uniref:Ketoreductase domain-containing protein n=1 Tax=Oppiella nova TaxID=334625 RepID=A0A7R9QRN6_9ACAR|nr:unnamed protein product [Oppiella nova]CAG2172487.1 unnamed protein product [Oppiella nova]